MDSRCVRRAGHDWRGDGRTGDYLLGDRDGVVIIPCEHVEEAITRTEAVMATESDMRAALLAGMDPIDAYNRFGKF